MKTFKDSAGREWTIALNLGTAKAVKDKLGIDLLQPEVGDPPPITRFGTDETFLAEVIFCLLEKQFEERKLTAEDVYDSFDGRTILDSQSAFYDELIDFFQSRGREDRVKAVAKQKQVIEMAIASASSRIDAFDVQKAIDGAMSGVSQV